MSTISVALAREIEGPGPDLTDQWINVIAAVKKMHDCLNKEGIVDAEKMRLTFASREDRKEFAKEAKAKGLSTRQIAKLSGTSQRQAARDVSEPNGSKSEPNGSAQINNHDPEITAKERKRLYSDKQKQIPSEDEARLSEQEALYDQACLILEEMSDATRRRFVAFIKETYDE